MPAVVATGLVKEFEKGRYRPMRVRGTLGQY